MTIRVAHLSTSHRGGAGVAAQQLSQALNDQGIDSVLITRNNLGAFQSGIVKNFSTKVIGRLVTQFQITNTRTLYGVATPISISNLNIKKLLRGNFDILHIHNWYNLLNISDLEELSRNIPIVFTFHDERLLTGGCHTTLGCRKFEETCQGCPAVKINHLGIVRAKGKLQNFFQIAENVSAISPSKWIVSQIHGAGLDNHFTSISHIPNIISSGYFTADVASRGPETPFKLLFISADLATEVKGLSLLLEALKSLSREATLELHLVGGGELPDFDLHQIQIIQHGFLNSNEVRALMTKSSFLVVPSISENSPNVIAEAQLVGLPVIASHVAGIPELVHDSLTGFLGEPNSEGISKAIMRAFATQDLTRISLAAQSEARIRYDIRSITNAHLEVYKKALASK